MLDDVIFINRDRKVGDIIFDTDREAGPIGLRSKEVIDSLDMLRASILRGDTITATDNLDIGSAVLFKSSKNIEI